MLTFLQNGDDFLKKYLKFLWAHLVPGSVMNVKIK